MDERAFMYFNVFHFCHGYTAQTTNNIVTHDGSKDAFWAKEVPFGGRHDNNLYFRICNPRKPAKRLAAFEKSQQNDIAQ